MYKNIVKSWTKNIDFIIWDVICLEVAFFISHIYINGFSRGGFPVTYENVMWVILVIDICVVFFTDSYESIVRRGYRKELKQVIIHCLGVTVGMIVWVFVVKQLSTYSRIVIIIMYPLSVAMMFVVRLVWKRIVRIRLRERKELRRLMVIATESRINRIVLGLNQPYRDYEISAAVLYDNAKRVGEVLEGVPVVADRDGILSYVRENIIDEVFIDIKECEKDEELLVRQLINMGVSVHVNLSQFTAEFGAREIHTFGTFTVMSTSMKFVMPKQVLFKRVLDVCGAIVGLILTGIIWLIFAPIIYYQSGGPIFFTQKRVGRNGRVFEIHKLRTMYLDAEERKKELMEQNKMKGLMFKMDNDPRIIPIGRFLRKSSIDEFPQFWNVLKGDMSLVGTRPPTVDEYKQYEVGHRKRLAVKPGITGMWQVSGRSDIVDFEEVVALDTKYITEWSLSLDVKIIWKTVKIVLGQKGAV